MQSKMCGNRLAWKTVGDKLNKAAEAWIDTVANLLSKIYVLLHG
jgi:hypothetical protein